MKANDIIIFWHQQSAGETGGPGVWDDSTDSGVWDDSDDSGEWIDNKDEETE